MDDSTFPLLLMGWIVCGILAATIAESRGGSAWAGLFVGLFLGPIGLVVALFLGDPRGRELRDIEQGDLKKCPQCAEIVKVEARVCRFCGHSFAGHRVAE